MDKAVASLRSIFHYILTDPGSKQRRSYYLSRWHSVLASSRSRGLDLSRARSVNRVAWIDGRARLCVQNGEISSLVH